MNKEKFGIVDSIQVVHKDRKGNIIAIHNLPIDKGLIHRLLVRLGLRHNTVTKYGMAIVAGLITSDVGETAFDYIGIGTGGATAITVDSEGLTTEIKRKAATGTRVTSTYTNDTMQLVATFSSADGLSGSSSVNEIGVFNASTGTQKMLFGQTYSPADVCNWDQGDSLAVTAKCQVKQGS